MNFPLALIVLNVVALAMLGGAVALVMVGRSRAQEEKTAARFEEVAFAGTRAGEASLPALPAASWLAAPLLRAGVVPQPWHPLALALALALAAIAGFAAGGAPLAVIVPGLAAVIAVLFLRLRAARVRERMYTQLPGFIDSTLRAVAAGRNLENALGAAREHTPMPLRAVFDRVLRRVQMGGDLGEGLEEARQVYRLQELALLRLVVVIGQRYGGSVKEPLGNIAALMRQHEQNRREVRALTGEVRLSAWIMGLLPAGIAVYVMSVNPQYLERMWADPSGQVALLVAGAMQVVGAVALWRMVKSVL